MATITESSGGIFRSAPFVRFFAGQALSYAGDGLRLIAIPLLVFQLTGSALSLGVTFALETLPFALFSLVGGSLADRLNRRSLMLVTDATRFLIMLSFSIGYATHHLSLAGLYTGVALLAACGAIFLGSQSSSIPYLLGKGGAKAAVSALVATEQTVGLIAPPIGGALFAVVGPLPALLANAGTYLTSQIAIASVADFGPEEPSGMPSLREIGHDVMAGWRFLMRDRPLRNLTFAQFFMNMFGVIGYVAIIPYIKRGFGASDHVVGFAFGALSLGAVIGSLVAGRTHWKFGRALTIAYLFDGLFWMPPIWSTSLVLSISMMAVSAAFGVYAISSLVAWRMRIIPEELMGRVFGVVRLFVMIGMLPGSLLGGWLADHYGARSAFLVSAIGYLAIAIWLVANRTIRRDER